MSPTVIDSNKLFKFKCRVVVDQQRLVIIYCKKSEINGGDGGGGDDDDDVYQNFPRMSLMMTMMILIHSHPCDDSSCSSSSVVVEKSEMFSLSSMLPMDSFWTSSCEMVELLMKVELYQQNVLLDVAHELNDVNHQDLNQGHWKA